MIEHQPRIPGPDLDSRDEIMAQIFDRGDPTPKRTLTFDNAVISYNADFVIHFRHPTWRDDRNDPRTATRVDGKKVRSLERSLASCVGRTTRR